MVSATRARRALRRDRSRRRRLRLWLALGAWAALLLALAWRIRGALPPSALANALRSPGAWIPVGVVLSALAALWFVRARLGALRVQIRGPQLIATPARLRRWLLGHMPTEVPLEQVVAARRVPLRDGAVLFLHPAADAPPVALPLTAPDVASQVGPLLDALPDAALAPADRSALEALAGADDLPARPAPGQTDAALAALSAAGLWALAAPLAWDRFLRAPDAPERAHVLWQVEGVRLGVAGRLRLLDALLTRLPDDPLLLLEAARHLALVRRRALAEAALARLPDRAPHAETASFWREVLRTHRALPAPPSRATFGIEVNLPHHELESDCLRVDGRWQIPLGWFAGFRLLPGLGGPPRGLALVTVQGESRLLRGDPLEWVGRLSRRAPWLIELHDVGLPWPPLGPRLRSLRA